MSTNTDIDFESWQVPALKDFLSKKGINCSIYLKRHLIKLCKLAVEIDLEDQNGDEAQKYEAFDVQRRTVNNIVLRKVDEIEVNEWSYDLKCLPDIEIADVFVWLLCSGWTQERLKCYRHDNGYKLYTNNHIDKVCLYKIPNIDCVYIKCETVPETRQNATPYQTWLLVGKAGNIHSGGCACVADDGSCKHCTSLLFAVSSFIERHKDRHTQVGTDVSCAWDKPRTSSCPVKIEDMKTSNSEAIELDVQQGPCHTVYNPCKNIQDERVVEKQLFKLCIESSSNSVLLHSLDPPSDYEEMEDISKIPDIEEVVKSAQENQINVVDHLKSVFTSDVISHVESVTRGQSECEEWHRHRRGRITASIFSKVVHCRNASSHDNYIIREILKSGDNLSHVPAIAYGKENEIIARQLYFDGYKKVHKGAKISLSGFHIFHEKPFMGASPDGLITCKCCSKGLIEIKCSFSHRNKTPYDIAGLSDYHLYRDDADAIHLRTDSPWYLQIQGQLGILDLPWCDFVFYTKRGLHTERITFDHDTFNSIVKSCSCFFETYLEEALLSE